MSTMNLYTTSVERNKELYAEIFNRENKDVGAEQQWSEVQAIAKSIDNIAETIRSNPTGVAARQLAEVVAYAARTLEHPPIELRQKGIQPQPELAEKLVRIIEDVERKYWLARDKELNQLMVDVQNGKQLSNSEYYEIDRFVEIGEQYPDIQVSKESSTAYWEERGKHMMKLQEQINSGQLEHDEQRAATIQLDYLQEMSLKHQEMRVKEQERVRREDEREQEYQAIINGLVDQAYSEASIGEIDLSTATNIAGYASTMRSTKQSSVAQEQVASVRDMADDIENGGYTIEEEEYEIES